MLRHFVVAPYCWADATGDGSIMNSGNVSNDMDVVDHSRVYFLIRKFCRTFVETRHYEARLSGKVPF